MKKVKPEYTYWYPADRQPYAPVLPGMERYPVKQRRKSIVPLNSLGHITHNNKLLCGLPKWKASKERDCTTGKTVDGPLAAIEVCQKCKQAYLRLGSSEVKKLAAWNGGMPKVF